MSSMDRMKVASSILSETMRKTSLAPYRFRHLQNTKSSSLMKQITRPQMYNSHYGRLLRSLLVIADSSSPVTTRTKSSLPSIPDVQSLTSLSREKIDKSWLPSSSKDSNTSWIKSLLDMSRRFLSNSSRNIFPIGVGSSMRFSGIQWVVRSTQESSQVFRM